MPRTPAATAPAWAQRPGWTVRQVGGERAYVCPGCGGPIAAGIAHLVAFPGDQPDLRRHWHQHCWRVEMRAPRHG